MKRRLKQARGKIIKLAGRYPLAGPFFWIASIQFFIIQGVVASAWPAPYSITNNAISDLGSTVCNLSSSPPVCSPMHTAMNDSFIALGGTIIVGALLMYLKLRGNLAQAIGFGFIGLAGVGTVLVGSFPENVAPGLHDLGATISFVASIVGLAILGICLTLPRLLRAYTLLSALVSLVGYVLLASQNYLSLGPGRMERIASHPQTVWLIVFGIYITASHFRERRGFRYHGSR